MERLYSRYRTWKYKNTFFLVISLLALFYLSGTDIGQQIINSISKLGYIGSFFAGIFFVSTFTVAPASVVLFKLAQIYNPFIIALTAGFGAVIGDYLIFRFLKDNVFREIKPVFMKLGGSNLSRLISTPYFAWLAPVIGALIIASPFPDEIGVGLMGISKLKNWQFLIISFLLNSLGILLIITIAKSV
ncbi:hypothetical protein A3D43_00015 [Candidatus Nomurabacteria bacterium RIFCSPHIGHO2_02_FULL_41_52]|nr:MAG: hypothetical protein A3D43_00015 [Candidatus Nomurabacteria bacterium RIFCSPHIGHO2_02_FULL_41_52]